MIGFGEKITDHELDRIEFEQLADHLHLLDLLRELGVRQHLPLHSGSVLVLVLLQLLGRLRSHFHLLDGGHRGGRLDDRIVVVQPDAHGDVVGRASLVGLQRELLGELQTQFVLAHRKALR